MTCDSNFQIMVIALRYLFVLQISIIFYEIKVLKKISLQHLLVHMLPVVTSLKHVLETNNSHLQVCSCPGKGFIKCVISMCC